MCAFARSMCSWRVCAFARSVCSWRVCAFARSVCSWRVCAFARSVCSWRFISCALGFLVRRALRLARHRIGLGFRVASLGCLFECRARRRHGARGEALVRAIELNRDARIARIRLAGGFGKAGSNRSFHAQTRIITLDFDRAHVRAANFAPATGHGQELARIGTVLAAPGDAERNPFARVALGSALSRARTLRTTARRILVALALRAAWRGAAL